jgi:hypothetical protein
VLDGDDTKRNGRMIKPNVVQAFTTGSVVQLFMLACDVPNESWSVTGSPDFS